MTLLQALAPAEPTLVDRVAWLVAVPLLGAAAFRALGPDRTDYLGHYLAGFGATLAAAWLAACVARGRPWIVAAACGACIVAGAALESTLFRFAAFDGIDFGAQSIGAVLAGLALLQGAAGDPALDPPSGTATLLRNGHGMLVATVALVALAAGTVYAFS